VLVVAPAALLRPSVPQPDGTMLYELVTGHPDRAPQDLVFLADLTVELRAWPGRHPGQGRGRPTSGHPHGHRCWRRGDLQGRLTAEEMLALVGPEALPRRVERGHHPVGCLPATVDPGRTLDDPPLIVGRLDRAHGVPRRRGRLIELPQRFGDHWAVLFEDGDRVGQCCPDVDRHQVGKVARLGHGSTSARTAQRTSALLGPLAAVLVEQVGGCLAGGPRRRRAAVRRRRARGGRMGATLDEAGIVLNPDDAFEVGWLRDQLG
jgi:hypothetical protein